MCRLLPDYPAFTAVVAGLSAAEHRTFREDLEHRIAAAGLASRVIFTGHVDAADMPVWYRRCLIAVAPGRYEGYGLTVLEAMASGSAAIATPTGAYATMIDDGVSGRLLPAADADALVAALRPLLADPTSAETMGRAGRYRAETFFSAAREAEAINAVYRELWAGNIPNAPA
jgi:mannosyltransferase